LNISRTKRDKFVKQKAICGEQTKTPCTALCRQSIPDRDIWIGVR